MSGITVVSGNSALEERLLALLGRKYSVRGVWSAQWRNPAEMAMDICAADPALVIFGGDLESDDVRYVVPEIDRQFPSSAIMVLTQTRDPDVVVEMLRLGARDVLDEGGDETELVSRVEQLLSLAIHRRQTQDSGGLQPRRRVISVLSPKGGTGKTTLAVNVAVCLAKRLPNQVLLVDLDVQFGDCAAALGVQPEHYLNHAVASASYDRSALKVFLTGHSSGLSLLPPPTDLMAADEIDRDEMKRTIGALAEEFPFVVMDTAAGIDSASIAAMEFATDFLLVSTTDVPSIRALRRQIDALDQIGFRSARRTFVLNRSNAKVGLSKRDIEQTIGMEALFEIPSSRSIPISTNEGIPIVEKDSGGLGRSFDRIADYFLPNAQSRAQSRFRIRRKAR